MTMTEQVEAALVGAVPTPDDQTVIDMARPVQRWTSDDYMSLFGAGAASLALVWLLYVQILPTSGVLGFLIVWYVVFLATYALVTSFSHSRPIVVDRVAGALVTGGALTVFFALATTIFFTFHKGWPAYSHLNFFTQTMAGVGPQDPMTKGGILHALVGSLIELSIAVAISLPLGLGTAIYMTEVGGGFAKVVRTVVEAMTALPDLVAGLFIYTVLIVGLGQSRTGLAASLAIAITMLPIIARSSEVVLRVVPGGLREAGLALGSSHWQTVRRVILPTARPGLATALILGVARGVGETAPVLITSGASTFMNTNPLKNPMNSLPLFVYSGVRSGQPAYITRGYGAASVLLAVVIVMFILIRLVTRQRVSKR